jgi:hypothetical protein
MKMKCLFLASVAAVIILTGCETVPPGVERGPHGTIGYDVVVEATPPGAQIEANGEVVGETPLHLKIFGDRDGTFHDFGSEYYVVRALPMGTNQYVQTRYFGTGRWFGPEDRIPQRIYFDMNQPAPAYGAVVAPTYVYPDYGPPTYYYGPGYYGPRSSFQFHFGVPLHHGYRGHHYRRH